MNQAAFLLSAFLIACGHTSQNNDPRHERDDLVQRLIKAHARILELELEKARATGKPPEEAKVLIAHLSSEFSEIRLIVFRELGNLPEELRKTAVPEILKLYPGHSETFKMRAVNFLGRLATPEAEAAVLGATRESSAAVRRTAAAALKPSTKEPAVQALIGLLDDPDKEVRLGAIDALGIPRREAAVAPLVARLSVEKDDTILEKIAGALGSIGSAAAVDPLLKLQASTPREGLRWYCLDSLGRIGDPRAAEPIREYLAASSYRLREVAIQALGKIKDTASLSRLAEILRKDPEESLRREAATSIGLMAPVEAIHSTLLPAYLEPAEKSEAVRRAIWEALLRLAADHFEPHETVASTLLKRGRRAEAEQLCLRLHGVKVGEAARARYLTLEEAIARGAFDSGDFRTALLHYRQFALQAPERGDIHRRVAHCYRQLGDSESALKTLRELDPKLPKGEAAWWENRLEILSILEKSKDPEPLIEEAHALLLNNPPAHPEDRKKLLDNAFRSGIQRLLQLLADPQEAVRKAALPAVQRVGKKMVPALVAELEGEPRLPGAVLEAGNAITGTAHDPASREPAKLKQAAADWKAWLQKKQ